MKLGICAGIGTWTDAPAGLDFIEGSVGGLLKPQADEAEFTCLLEAVRACPVPVLAANCFIPGSIPTTGPNVNIEILDTYVTTALRRAGIENFRWHDLRHSAASFLAKNGASLIEIGAVLGHKSANTTKRYSHLTEQHTHALVRGMSDKLLGND